MPPATCAGGRCCEASDLTLFWKAVPAERCASCAPARAQQEGWLREGAVPRFDGRDSSSHRRRPLFGRIRRRMPTGEAEDLDGWLRPEEPPAPPARATAPEPPRPCPQRATPRPGGSHEPRAADRGGRGRVQRLGASADDGRDSAIARAPGRFAAARHDIAWQPCASWWPGSCAGTGTRPTSVTTRAQSGWRIRAMSSTSSIPGELEPNAAADEGGLLHLDA